MCSYGTAVIQSQLSHADCRQCGSGYLLKVWLCFPTLDALAWNLAKILELLRNTCVRFDESGPTLHFFLFSASSGFVFFFRNFSILSYFDRCLILQNEHYICYKCIIY